MWGKIFKVLTVTTALSLSCTSYAATLSDSVSQAIGHHPKMQAGQAAREAARKNIWEQNSAFFPTIGVTARTGRVNADDDTTRVNTGADAYSWLGEGSVTLTQPVFAGFSVVNRVQAAKDRFSAADDELGGTAEDIALKAARAHLNLMRTRELLDFASKYLSEIQSRKDNIQLMVKEGAADEAELLQADEILMAAKTTRLGYEEAFRQAEADYIETVGEAPAETLEFGEAAWDKLLSVTMDEALVAASADNPRLTGADSIVAAMGRDADAERGSLYPRVDAEMSYLEKDQHDNLGGEMTNAQAMLKMSWNFSTGGGQLARVAKGLEQQRGAQAKRLETLRSIERDVRQKFTSMQIVDQQFALFTDREAANEKIVENYLSQFEGGKQSNLQLISANSRLFESRAAKTDSYYRRLLSRFELLSAMGRLSKAFGAAPQQAAAN